MTQHDIHSISGFKSDDRFSMLHLVSAIAFGTQCNFNRMLSGFRAKSILNSPTDKIAGSGRVAKKLKLTKWFADESGATAIEYGLIAAAMALALIPAMMAFSGNIGGVYGRIVGYFALV